MKASSESGLWAIVIRMRENGGARAAATGAREPVTTGTPATRDGPNVRVYHTASARPGVEGGARPGREGRRT
jgi:hypothetical protein